MGVDTRSALQESQAKHAFPPHLGDTTIAGTTVEGDARRELTMRTRDSIRARAGGVAARQSLVAFFLLCLGFLLTSSVPSLFGQNRPVATLGSSTTAQTAPPTSAPFDDPNNPKGYFPSKKPRITPQELARLRLLEMKSGAFTEAARDPGSQQLVGPPLTDREKVMHAMSRLAFGPRPSEVEATLLEGGLTDQWKTWVQNQLKPSAIDDSALERDLASRFPEARMSVTELYEKYPERGEVARILQEMVVTRAIRSNRQLTEVLAEFWRNHFCVDISPNESKPRAWAALNYEETVIRPNLFGKFKDLLLASARHPAMLDYLDNQLSRKDNWNENYARELMELHTVGVDRGYTDYDVIELSKVLTGWQFEKDYQFKFNAGQHQPGSKKVMGYTIAAGQAGGEQALYMLATHKYTANFIATKLCKYFVNDAPPPPLVTRVENVFLSTKGDLSKVYEAIFFSPEFMDRVNFRAKFKTPFEFVISANRAVDAEVTSCRQTNEVLKRMGQEVYNCPDPTGYFDRAEAWLDSGVLTRRWDYSLQLTRGEIKGSKPNDAAFARYKGKATDELYQRVVRELICDDIGDRTRTVLKEAADAGDVRRMYAVLMGCPSFQQQ